MFATFGNITLEVLASPSKWESERKWKYEALPVIGGRPILQWIFDDLRKIEWTIKLHQMWCNPAGALQQMEAIASTHIAQSLVLGNTQVLGKFVIEGMRVKHEWHGDNGYLVSADVELDLLEYIEAQQPAGAQPADNTDLGTPAPGLTGNQGIAPGQDLQLQSPNLQTGIPYNSSGYSAVPLTTITREGI